MDQAEIGYYYPTGHEAHFEYGHPERPERIEAIRQALENCGYWQRGLYLAAEPLEVSKLRMVHSDLYIKQLQESSSRGKRLDADTYLTPASWDLALTTASGGIAVAAAVWERRARRGFALTRPPGHHATVTRGMGFCLLNNIALAADHLLRNYSAQRVAIVDLDLHHGNGTQDIFWERSDVLFVSVHQSPLYPGSGAANETGLGAGHEYTLNIPLPPGSGDEAYWALTQEILLPMLTRVEPEMLLVSFGFDPHWRDPLGHLQLSSAGYGRVISELTSWSDRYCKGRIALFLEGGYDLGAAAACGNAVVAALLGESCIDSLGPSPRSEGKSWQKIVEHVKTTWDLVS